MSDGIEADIGNLAARLWWLAPGPIRGEIDRRLAEGAVGTTVTPLLDSETMWEVRVVGVFVGWIEYNPDSGRFDCESVTVWN